MTDPQHSILALSVGNSRVRIGLFDDEELVGAQSFSPTDVASVVAWSTDIIAQRGRVPLIVGTVNPAHSKAIGDGLLATGRVGPLLTIGRDVPIPLESAVREPERVGHDRLLCAMAAFVSTEGPCIVVDAGTAITVDYIDAEGVFQGGAIAPGLRIMLDALHQRTAALPAIEFDPKVELEPIGKDTRSAMMVGVVEGARGMVHRLIDRYALHVGGYPRVVATGGDAAALFTGDELVEHVVPDLQLMGIRMAFAAFVNDEDEVA